jgi:hypothetical protein
VSPVVIQTEKIIEARVIRPESMLINGNLSFPGWGTFPPPSTTSLFNASAAGVKVFRELTPGKFAQVRWG